MATLTTSTLNTSTLAYNAFAIRERSTAIAVVDQVIACASILDGVMAKPGFDSGVPEVNQAKLALSQDIGALQGKIAAAEAAAQSGKAEQAAEKAKCWGIIQAIVQVVLSVVIAVIAVMTAIWSGGTSLVLSLSASYAASANAATVNNAASIAAASNAVGTLKSFLEVAALNGHPLAGEAARILAQVSVALSEYSSKQKLDETAARVRLLGELRIAQTKLDQVTLRIPFISGKCTGDPTAALEAVRRLAPLLTRLQKYL